MTFFQPHIDPAELEDGKWFSRADVKTAFANTLKFQKDPRQFKNEPMTGIMFVPPAGALAHDLIKKWISDENS